MYGVGVTVDQNPSQDAGWTGKRLGVQGGKLMTIWERGKEGTAETARSDAAN